MLSQKKIAQILGMPPSTVANILNGRPRYKKETRDRVLNKAKELGYQRNRASVAVKRGRSNLIGIVHFSMSYEIVRRAVVHLTRAITEKGYDFLVVDLTWHGGNAERAVNELIQTRVEGVVLLSNTDVFNPQHLAMLERARIPVVSVYGETDMKIPLIGYGARAGFFSMTKHLQGIGHRCILHPSFAGMSTKSVSDRVQGFELAIKGNGSCLVLSENEFISSWPRLYRKYQNESLGIIVQLDERDMSTAHYELTKQIIASGVLPDAVLCLNDLGACGVINAAYEAKVRVPEDMAVTGADNDSIGEFSMFRLTSIRSDVERSCKTAVELVLKCIKGEIPKPLTRSFPVELVLRQSCGRIIKPGQEAVSYVTAQQPPPEKKKSK